MNSFRLRVLCETHACALAQHTTHTHSTTTNPTALHRQAMRTLTRQMQEAQRPRGAAQSLPLPPVWRWHDRRGPPTYAERR